MSKQKEEVDKQKEIEENIDPNQPLSDKQEKELAKERAKPKEYSVDTFHRPLNSDEKKEFDGLGKEDQKIYIIKRWVAENRSADTKDMHEVSLDDMRLAGLMPQEEG